MPGNGHGRRGRKRSGVRKKGSTLVYLRMQGSALSGRDLTARVSRQATKQKSAVSMQYPRIHPVPAEGPHALLAAAESLDPLVQRKRHGELNASWNSRSRSAWKQPPEVPLQPPHRHDDSKRIARRGWTTLSESWNVPSSLPEWPCGWRERQWSIVGVAQACLTTVWMHRTLMRTPTTECCRSGEADLLVTSETASRDFSHGSPDQSHYLFSSVLHCDITVAVRFRGPVIYSCIEASTRHQLVRGEGRVRNRDPCSWRHSSNEVIMSS